MRILSNFHDYYDPVQREGQDLELLYLRRPRKADLRQWLFPSDLICRWHICRLVTHIVGFCGKIYPVVAVSPDCVTGEVGFCYTLEEINRFVEANFRKRNIEIYHSSSYSPSGFRQKNLRKFFAECALRRDSFEDIFRDNACPVFIATYRGFPGTITYNGALGPLQFYKLFDAYTAFQEIQMYLGGMARPNKEIPVVSDRDMVVAKGFGRWSFRKPPTKHK